MPKRLLNMSIHNKLFGVFALTTIVAALSVLVSLLILLVSINLSEDLIRNHQVAQRAYQAQTYLQEMERVEKSFILNNTVDEANTFLVYVALFEDYYRQAILEASDLEIKNALYEIERAKNAYVQVFGEITKAMLTPTHQVIPNDLIDQATLEMENLREQISLINAHAWNTVDQGEKRLETFILIAIIVNVFSLIDFLIMAAIAIFVLSRGVFGPAALLSEATQAVKEGNFAPDMLAPMFNTTDEMSELARTFIQTIDVIKAKEKELQAQIKETRLKLSNYE